MPDFGRTSGWSDSGPANGDRNALRSVGCLLSCEAGGPGEICCGVADLSKAAGGYGTKRIELPERCLEVASPCVFEDTSGETGEVEACSTIAQRLLRELRFGPISAAFRQHLEFSTNVGYLLPLPVAMLPDVTPSLLGLTNVGQSLPSFCDSR